MTEPADLAEALGLIADLSPLVVVDVGQGDKLTAWRSVCHYVYGIVPGEGLSGAWPPGVLTGSGEPVVELFGHGIRVLIGDPASAAAREWLTDCLVCEENPTVAHAVDALIIDADHAGALESYAPLVRPGGLILVRDGDEFKEAAHG